MARSNGGRGERAEQARGLSRDHLQRLLTQRYEVSAPLAAELATAFSPQRHASGETLLRAGARDDFLYFIDQGVLRVFYTAQGGREHNKAFVSEGMFFVALSSHLSKAPVRFSVQALTDVTLLKLRYLDFERWAEREAQLARLWRRYMEAHFVRHEAREAALQLEDARGRYLWFRAQHPALVERVPLYHVASYLGVTNVTLSRVRRALARARS